MTADREALVAEVAGMLAEHEYDVHIGGTVRPACKCGWVADLEWSSTHVYDLHVADALADLLAAREQQARAEALREAADDTAAFAEETYGEWLFRRPTTGDYAEINALLKQERGHQLDGVAGACYHHALMVRAEMLREKAAEIEADA